MFDLRKAQVISRKVQFNYKKTIDNVKWSEIYTSEQEIIEDLKKIHIPKDSELSLLRNIYSGYEFIHSFSKQVKSGEALSEKQMIQCKRLSLEIKKAVSIVDCWE